MKEHGQRGADSSPKPAGKGRPHSQTISKVVYSIPYYDDQCYGGNAMAETYKQGILHNAHEKSNIPFPYMLYDYSVKKPIGELNLKRALDKDTGVFSFFFSLLSSSSPLGQTAVSGNSTLHQ